MKSSRYELRMQMPAMAANSSPAHVPTLGQSVK
jgi:hypothetical protein